MRITCIFLAVMLLLTASVSGYTIKDMPYYNSMFYMGLVSDIGTGIDFGLNFEFQLGKLKLAAEVEEVITDVNYEQNVNITKFGLLYRIYLTDAMFMDIRGGAASFYAPLSMTYSDFYTGKKYTTPDNYQGRLTYWGVGLNFKVNDYIVTPAVSMNAMSAGGTVMEIQLNIGHKI